MTRYLIVLAIGLFIVALISAAWIRHANIDFRLGTMEIIAEETIHRITDANNNNRAIPIPTSGDPERFQRQDINPTIYITDVEGQIIRDLSRGPKQLEVIPTEALNSNEEKQQIEGLDGRQETFYIVKQKVEINDEHLGWVVVMERQEVMIHSNQAYGQLAWMIVTLALIGLGAIYYLTSRLAKPIKEVALAAKEIQQGNYAVELPHDSKEAEVYELMESFREMATRLQQLEAMRTELLAGVTHELKTPVTAIDGLLQALKDGVVTGDEAREFIGMAMVETKKMKTMVGDLLAFNSFAVNAIPVKIEKREINQFMKETIAQWQTTNEFEKIQVQLTKTVADRVIDIDTVRLQQIFTNLFTNAAQAMQNQGMIDVYLQEDEQYMRIFVEDKGRGIPEQEHKLIFDRFYRGEDKKYTVRGLGLGLALSKMMAQSIKAQLKLVRSDTNGSIFVVEFKKSS